MREIVATDFTLEPLTAAHADEMFAVLSDPSIYAHIDDQPPISVDALRERFQRLETRTSPDGAQQWLNWAVRVHSCELVGFVQATIHADKSAAVAFVLHSRFWGLGLGRRATLVMLRRLSDDYNVRVFHATAARSNHRSLRLLRGLGFTEIDPAAFPHENIDPGDVALSLNHPSASPTINDEP